MAILSNGDYYRVTSRGGRTRESRYGDGVAAESEVTHRMCPEDATPPTAAPPQTYRVLVVNPGSTSMKVAVYENGRCIHSDQAQADIPVSGTPDQRRQAVEKLTQDVADVLAAGGIVSVDAVAGRGGFLPRTDRKLPGGTYRIAERREGKIVVDDAIVSALLERPEKDHASNFGIPLAAALAERLGVEAFSVDPVVVDEFAPEAELSGYAPIVRRSTSHALNIRAAIRRAAEAIGRPPEQLDLVVAHLGGGITVAAVRGGKMVDNTIALLGGGPFTPQRAGQLPTGELIDLCYSCRFTRDELKKELTKNGGLRSYLGTDRVEEVEARIEGGDGKAAGVLDAMVYQIAKEIGAAYVASGCQAEAIVLTGGMARSRRVCRDLRRRVGRLAPVMIFPGSLEMQALAAGAVDVLTGRARALRYEAPELPKSEDGRDE